MFGKLFSGNVHIWRYLTLLSTTPFNPGLYKPGGNENYGFNRPGFLMYPHAMILAT
jgi:hypothetical protein